MQCARGEGGGGGESGGGCQHELAAPYSYASAECTQSCSCETCTHMYLYPQSQVASLSALRWRGPIASSRGRGTTLLPWNSITFRCIDLHKQSGWRQGSFSFLHFSFLQVGGRDLSKRKLGSLCVAVVSFAASTIWQGAYVEAKGRDVRSAAHCKLNCH